MSERVFEDNNSFQIDSRGRDIEVYVFEGDSSKHITSGSVIITVKEDADYDSQNASFTMTAEEATRMKEFLIRKGY